MCASGFHGKIFFIAVTAVKNPMRIEKWPGCNRIVNLIKKPSYFAKN